jgi:hypothetical protein
MLRAVEGILKPTVRFWWEYEDAPNCRCMSLTNVQKLNIMASLVCGVVVLLVGRLFVASAKSMRP